MIIARRYARALYEEAERQSKTSTVDDDVQLIRASLEQSDELMGFFRSPVIPREKKEAVIRELFGKRVDPSTLHFLEMLVDKQREDVLPEIVEAYRTLRDEQLGIVEARARVAAPLDEPERKRLMAAIERLTGKKVRLQIQTDDRLLGGIIIRIEDTVFDGSVRHHLERLREKMELGSYSLN